MNKNIFVTAFQAMPNKGSENYVGFYIVNTLINKGYNVYLYTPLINQIEIRNYFSVHMHIKYLKIIFVSRNKKKMPII